MFPGGLVRFSVRSLFLATSVLDNKIENSHSHFLSLSLIHFLILTPILTNLDFNVCPHLCYYLLQVFSFKYNYSTGLRVRH